MHDFRHASFTDLTVILAILPHLLFTVVRCLFAVNPDRKWCELRMCVQIEFLVMRSRGHFAWYRYSVELAGGMVPNSGIAFCCR